MSGPVLIKSHYSERLNTKHISLEVHDILTDSSEEKQGGMYRGADKSLARPTYRRILFDGENISFDASLASTNIPPVMIINRIYETQNLLSL